MKRQDYIQFDTHIGVILIMLPFIVLKKAPNGYLRRARARHEDDDRDVRVLVVLGLINLNPYISSRQIERETGILQRTVIKILRRNRYHPYYIILTQALNDNDMRNRVTLSRWAEQMIFQDPNFLITSFFLMKLHSIMQAT